ncbi:oligopeptide/dipeptide ABC transporter ATP-binding protein [Roseburia hominis]
MSEIILKVEHLNKEYSGRSGRLIGKQNVLKALNDVSFQIEKGKILGLVGESGCGKSTVAKAVLNLIPVNGGNVLFDGNCLYDIEKNTRISRKKMEKLRREIQIVFQDPASCLDPRKNVEQIICEGIEKHKICDKKEMRDYCIEVMEKCGLDKTLLMRYPHELSGGQKQRIAIARVFALHPKFIVCDEITSALDVSVQSQILNLLLDLKEQSGLTYLFISHNLDIVKNFCDDVMIMYMGEIVESGTSVEIYSNPVHPYTKLLMESVPVQIPEDRKEQKEVEIKKEKIEKGCSFFSRCKYATEKCREEKPKLEKYEGHHFVCCHYKKDYIRLKKFV